MFKTDIVRATDMLNDFRARHTRLCIPLNEEELGLIFGEKDDPITLSKWLERCTSNRVECMQRRRQGETSSIVLIGMLRIYIQR